MFAALTTLQILLMYSNHNLSSKSYGFDEIELFN